MQCTIYRSNSRAYTYLYLAEGKELADLPEALLQHFGEPEWVMALNLGQRQKLAQADLGTVKLQLVKQGFYLQLPPEKSVEEILRQQFS